MSDHDHLTVNSARNRDDELFTTPSTDPVPDRHPSILRPGGHSSPLKHPSALRPGAARNSRTPSPSSHGPTSPPAKHSPSSSQHVAYKAYSPSRPQSPDELSAQIEGYFTALQVPPLHVSKSPEPVNAGGSGATAPQRPPKQYEDPIQRVASPPVPPKERIPVVEPSYAVSPVSPVTPVSELDAYPDKRSDPVNVDEEEAPPPPYEPSQYIPPPPEKTPLPTEPRKGSPVGAAVASTSKVGGAASGLPVNDAIANSSAALAAITLEEPTPKLSQPAPEADEDDIYSAGPPPLPPRSPTGTGKGKEPATAATMPGAFPPPPTASSPKPAAYKASAEPASYKASGAAATSAAGVGGSIAGVGTSAGLKQARKALEKGLGHLIDKAKEHHHAREEERKKASGGRKQSPDGGRKKKKAEGSEGGGGGVAQVRMMKP